MSAPFPSTGLQRQSSGNSFGQNSLSGDYYFPATLSTATMTINPDACGPLVSDGVGKAWAKEGTEAVGSSSKSWAQQVEETYQLQLALALSIFADLRSSATEENPHISLTKFFTLNRLIDQPNKTSSRKDNSQISKPTYSDNEKFRKKISHSDSRNSPKLHLDPHLNEKQDWAKADGMKEIQEVKATLLKESQSWFLKFLEGALSVGFHADTRIRKGSKDRPGGYTMDRDGQIAVTLSQLKHASDWLDQIQDIQISGNDELVETVNRLKQKIYACLLGHVDSAASALESRNYSG